MKAVTLEELTAIERNPSRLSICVLVGPDRDGGYARLTNHDRPIEVNKGALAGTYLPSRPVEGTEIAGTRDMSVDNMQIVTPIDGVNLTLNDIRAGLFNNLPVQYFVTDWAAPHNVGIVLLKGLIGRVEAVSEMLAQIELRGLKQYLQTTIVDVSSSTCRAKLGVNTGDNPCDVDLAAYTVTAQISSIDVQRRVFTSTDVAGEALGADWFRDGRVVFNDGANAGYASEIAGDDGAGELNVFEIFPANFEVGDEFEITAGCDHSARGPHGCKIKFGDIKRFQGEPDIPGLIITQKGAE